MVREATKQRLQPVLDHPYFSADTVTQALGERGYDPYHFLLNPDYFQHPPSRLFDPVAYVEAFPDVANFELHPVAHYVELGAAEARLALPFFDPSEHAPRPILFDSHDLDLSGAPMEMARLIPALGFARDRSYVSAPGPGALDATWAAAGFSVLHHGLSHRRVHDLAGFHRLRARAVDVLNRLGVQAVYANSIMAFPVASAALQLGLPLVWVIHEPTPAEFLDAFPDDLCREVLRDMARAQGLIFVADAARDSFAAHAPGLAAATVIEKRLPPPPVLSLADQRRAGAALELELDALMVLSVGSFSPRKGQLDLIHALERAGPTLAGKPVHTVFIGENGSDYATEVRAGIDALRAQGHKITCLPQSQSPQDRAIVQHAFNVADIFVMSSTAESRPLTVSEALQAGCPVICADVAGVRDEIEPGVNGRLYVGGDGADLAQALQALGADAQHRRHLAKGALLTAERNSKEYADMLGAYRQLIEAVLPMDGLEVSRL